MKIYNFPEEWIRFREDFIDYNRTKLGRLDARIIQLNSSIDYLYEFLMENKKSDIASLGDDEVRKLQFYIYRNKHLSTFRSMSYFMNNLRMYYRYLYHKNMIPKNPFENALCIGMNDLTSISSSRRYNFEELISKWKKWMKKERLHIETLKERMDSVALFMDFLKQKKVKSIYKVTPGIVDEYKNYLRSYQYKSDLNYRPLTQVRHLSNICKFLLFLMREGIIKNDPASHLELSKYHQILKQQCNMTLVINHKRPIEARVDDPEMQRLFKKFITYFYCNGGSKEHGKGYLLSIEKFYKYMKEIGIKDLRKLSRKHLMDYQLWLYNQISKKGTRYAPNTMLALLVDLRSFFRYLTKSEYLPLDPSASIDMPKEEQGIPNTCMTEREVQLLLDMPNVANPIGLRDKTILEVLYSTALRANELICLSTSDINFKDGLLRVEYPKGGKSYQRIVPIGKTACEYVRLFLDKVRPTIANADSGEWLFLSFNGRKMIRSYLSCMIRKYLFHAGIRKKITTHSFRVTCATHMLKNNADIRYVQEQLGHRSIRTTQGYTRLVPKDLKAVHDRCHPREKKNQ